MGVSIASKLLMDLGKESKKAIFRRITNKGDISSIYVESFKKTGKKLLSKHPDYKKFKRELKKLLTSSLELLNGYFEKNEISLDQVEDISNGKTPQEFLDSFHCILRKNKIRLTSTLCKDFLSELFTNVKNTFYSLVSEDDSALYREIILRELALSGKRTKEIIERQKELKKQVESIENLLKNFKIINFELFKQDDDLSFYYGRRPTWRDIASDRDVIREIFYEIFRKIIDSKKAEKSSYLPIIAAGGEGKSTLLMRIAYELFAQGEMVIFADATGFTLNPFNEIKNIYANLINPYHLFVIIDNMARLRDNYDQLLYQLSIDNDIKVTLIGASRIDDWIKIEHKHTSNLNYIYKENTNPYKMDLTEYDFYLTLEALEAKNLLKASKSDRIGKSFIALMLNLTYGEKVAFDQYIIDEAESLSHNEKIAYTYVSALDRFGLGMPRSLLLRIMGEREKDSLYNLQRKGVVNLIPDDIFEARHELIAEIIYKNHCTKKPIFIKEKDIYMDIINSSRLTEEETIVILLQGFLEKSIINVLKPFIIEKYMDTFLKSKSHEILSLGWGPIFDEIVEPSYAENAYRRTLELKEDYPDAHNAYAILLYKLNRDEEAEEHYKRALKLKEDYPDAHNAYAILLDKLNRDEEAEEHYKRALKLKEDYPGAHNNYAILLDKLNRDEEAEEHYQRALELKEDDPDAHYNYATLLDELNRDEEAEEHYQRALELKEDDPDAHYNYATLLDKLNRDEEAEEHYQRALELKEDDPEV